MSIPKRIEIKGRSFSAICPDCGNCTTMVINGDIRITELATKVSMGRTRFKSLDDLDFDFRINMRCKSCYEKHDCEDDCIVENYALIRLLSAFNNFGHSGMSVNVFCDIAKNPKVVDGNMVMVFTMPAVSYVLPRNIKEDLDSILSTLMVSPDMCENGSYVVLTRETYTDNTDYYKIEFSLDASMVNLIYDPKIHGRDYKSFVDKMFIRKIDKLAALLECFSLLEEEK